MSSRVPQFLTWILSEICYQARLSCRVQYSEKACARDAPMSLYYCLSVRTGAALTLAWSILYSAANLAIAASHVVGLFELPLFQIVRLKKYFNL